MNEGHRFQKKEDILLSLIFCLGTMLVSCVLIPLGCIIWGGVFFCGDTGLIPTYLAILGHVIHDILFGGLSYFFAIKWMIKDKPSRLHTLLYATLFLFGTLYSIIYYASSDHIVLTVCQWISPPQEYYNIAQFLVSISYAISLSIIFAIATCKISINKDSGTYQDV